MKFLASIAITLISATVFASADEADEMGKMNYNLKELPTEGRILDDSKGWSGEYWAFKWGGINLRWNTSEPTGYFNNSPAREKVLKMSQEQLAKLAPSEKWSILHGDYEYEFVEEIASETGTGRKEWAGICHGWAPASVYHKEPTPKSLVNKDGVTVPFGSGDIKALLSYFYADQQESASGFGGKCFFSRFGIGIGGCGGDTNPAALHVTFANMIGLQKVGFIMDRDPGREIWNQPVVAFKVKKQSKPRRVGDGYEIDFSTDLIWTQESAPTWNLVYKTEGQKEVAMELEYTLELDRNFKIVDGSWAHHTEYPDFVWTTPKLDKFPGNWTRLDELLND